MATNTNVVILSGRLTRKPEIKVFDSGSKVANVGLAVNKTKKDKAGDYVEDVNYWDLKFFNRQAELVEEYLDKGRQIFVTGKLDMEHWEKDGEKRSKAVILVDNFEMVGSRPAEQAEKETSKKA